jgi:hypothetical protein
MWWTARATHESDLEVKLIAALQEALRERRLDVADHLLSAIELHGADRTTEAAYQLVANTVDSVSGRELEH